MRGRSSTEGMGPKGGQDPMEVWQESWGHLLEMLGSLPTCTSWLSSLWLPASYHSGACWRPSPPALLCCSPLQTLDTMRRKALEGRRKVGRVGYEATVCSLWWGQWAGWTDPLGVNVLLRSSHLAQLWSQVTVPRPGEVGDLRCVLQGP